MSEKRYKINVNYQPDENWEPDWVEMTKVEYFNEWNSDEDNWQEMTVAGAIEEICDPMTEGAKTGTLSDKLSRHIETEMEAEQGMMESAARRCLHTDACYHQGKKAAFEEVKEWLRENKDDTLTEALKVAGEAEGKLALAIDALKQIKALKEESFGDYWSSSLALKTEDVHDICDQALCAILPIEEVRKELAEQGISTDALKDWASKRLAEVRAKNCTHDWELTWPNEPCEYTCKICGTKQQH